MTITTEAPPAAEPSAGTESRIHDIRSKINGDRGEDLVARFDKGIDALTRIMAATARTKPRDRDRFSRHIDRHMYAIERVLREAEVPLREAQADAREIVRLLAGQAGVEITTGPCASERPAKGAPAH